LSVPSGRFARGTVLVKKAGVASVKKQRPGLKELLCYRVRNQFAQQIEEFEELPQ